MRFIAHMISLIFTIILGGGIIIAILQMWKLSQRAIKWLAQVTQPVNGGAAA